MTIDQAVGKLYQFLGEHRNDRGYMETLQALGIVEEAVGALDNSQKVLNLTMSGDYDVDLHGVMLHNAIKENHKLLVP